MRSKRTFVQSLLMAASLLTWLVAPSHAATLTLTTNQGIFRTGDTLALSVGVAPTNDAGVKSDIYVAVVLPSGAVLTLAPNLGWNAALVPIVTAFSLANLQAPNFYVFPLPDLPGGIYNFHVIATPTGTSPLNSGARLGAASAPMIFQTTATPISTTVACSTPQYCGPIIDNHAHPIGTSGSSGIQDIYFDGLVALMDQNGVAMTALHRNGFLSTPTGPAEFSSSHDLWVASASLRHPGKILAYLAGFDPSSPDALTYIQDQFRTSSQWKAIGELDLRNPFMQTQISIDSPNMLAVLKLAGQLRAPVIIHHQNDYGVDFATGLRELEDALSANPDTIVMMAHMPGLVLMARHPNLWAEITLGAPGAEQLLTSIVQSYPTLLDRIVLCVTDLQSPDLMVAGLTYGDVLAANRRVLGTLTREQAEKIAYKNLARLLEPFPIQP